MNHVFEEMCKRRYNIHGFRLASIHSTHMSKHVQSSRHNYAMNNYKLSIQVWNVTRVLFKKSGFERANEQTVSEDE